MLALLYVTVSRGGIVTPAWKAQHAEALNRLHAKGWIHVPCDEATSVTLTAEGKNHAKQAYEKLFGEPSTDGGITAG
jgi:uncharacterized protein DUF6429